MEKLNFNDAIYLFEVQYMLQPDAWYPKCTLFLTLITRPKSSRHNLSYKLPTIHLWKPFFNLILTGKRQYTTFLHRSPKQPL